MANLLSNDTDLEIERYMEAQEIVDFGLNIKAEKNKKSVFNPETRRNDVLLPMSSGGYVKIGEEAPEVMAETPAQPAMPSASDVAPAQAAAEEAKRLQEIQGSYSLDDLRAAGYTDEQISAAGLDVQPTMPERRTEPLSEQEVRDIIASGEPLFTADPTLRDTGSQIFTTFLYDAAVEGLKDELREQGIDPAQIDRMVAAQQSDLLRNAEVYSNALFGTGPTGMEVGAADFLTAGIMDIQEGRRLFNQQRPEKGGTLGGRAMGALIMAAGIAEATGVGYAFGKLLKRGAKALEPTLVRMGEEAQGRIDAEGATLFSNPVGPIVDRGLAAAGRFLDTPRARSVDEFAELAASGKLRQARTVTQDIADISEKKMPATVINLQGADDELSIAYESGEITNQLEQAGLFVDDDQMGTIYVGTTQENLDAIKSAENPAEIGKLSGYSDADVAAFYLKRRGGDKKTAFQEYRSDLADARAKERDQIRQRSRQQDKAPDTSYRMEHQPRGPEGGEGIRLDDLTKNISGEQAGYPDDFYTSQGMEIYARGPSFEGDEYGLANQESYEIIASVKENPDAEVTIYRAVPDEDAITTINPGDFVTLSPTYAKLHAASGYGRSGDEAGKVLEETVKVRDIYWDGNDVNEFGYFPEEE